MSEAQHWPAFFLLLVQDPLTFPHLEAFFPSLFAIIRTKVKDSSSDMNRNNLSGGRFDSTDQKIFKICIAVFAHY